MEIVIEKYSVQKKFLKLLQQLPKALDVESSTRPLPQVDTH